MSTLAPEPRPRVLRVPEPPRTALSFVWLVAVMFAVLLVAAAALGMYEAVLAAELAALSVLALTALWLRVRPAPAHAELRIQRRHRERRGF